MLVPCAVQRCGLPNAAILTQLAPAGADFSRQPRGTIGWSESLPRMERGGHAHSGSCTCEGCAVETGNSLTGLCWRGESTKDYSAVIALDSRSLQLAAAGELRKAEEVIYAESLVVARVCSSCLMCTPKMSM